MMSGARDSATITPPCSPTEVEEGELLDDVQELDEIRFGGLAECSD